MNTLQIKINSFKKQNKVFINEMPVSLNSEFMNYYSKSIDNVIDKLFETAEIEFNDYYNVEFYGNKYEQALAILASKKSTLCDNISCGFPSVNLNLQDRLALVKPFKNSIYVDIQLLTNEEGIELPKNDCLTYANESTNNLIVSDDLDFIKANLTQKDKVAFYIDGESQMYGKNYVIGCQKNEVHEYIQDYLATCYINPVIHEVVKNVKDISSEVNIADCTEPYYYVGNNITLTKGEEYILPIYSHPENSSLENIKISSKNTIVSIEGLKIKAEEKGSSYIEIFNDAPIPFATIKIDVVIRNFVEQIELDVKTSSNIVRTGTNYDFSVSTFPNDAVNQNELRIEVDDSSIAHIESNKLIINKAGEFNLIAKCSQVIVKKTFTAKNKIEKISLSSIPKKIYIGDVFEIQTKTSPDNLYDDSYKWITSDSSIAVVGKDNSGKEFIKINGIGEATISCISNDDEKVFDTVRIASESTFNKRSKAQPFVYLGIFILIFMFIYFLF